MKGKAYAAIFGGVFVAGLICLIVGLIVFFTTQSGLQTKLISLFAMICGGIMAGIGLFVFIILLIVNLVAKSAKKKDDEEAESEEG